MPSFDKDFADKLWWIYDVAGPCGIFNGNAFAEE
jgi:hypothetical protein